MQNESETRRAKNLIDSDFQLKLQLKILPIYFRTLVGLLTTVDSDVPVISVTILSCICSGDAPILCDGGAPKWQTTPFYMPMSVVSPTAGLAGQHILTVNFTKEQVDNSYILNFTFIFFPVQ